MPEETRRQLTDAGADVVVAASPDEAAAALQNAAPDVVLVLPPARASEAAPLLPMLQAMTSPPPVFVLGPEAAGRPVALELLPAEAWSRATASLRGGAGESASAVLLTRLQLAALLSLWEEAHSRDPDLDEHALMTVARVLDASRVTLFRWKAGDPVALVLASSLGVSAVGRKVEIVRYPELRAAAGRSGPVLVEEVNRDPLMEDASGFLAGVPIRSLLCQRLPGEGSVLYLHAVRETAPFGLTDVAMMAAASRLLQAARRLSGPGGPAEKPEKRRLRTIELLFRGIPEPTALVSPTGEILLVNPAFRALTGRLESELVGLDYRSLLRPPHAEDGFGESPPGDPDLRRELARVVTAAGEAIPVEVLTLPASDETYSQTGWSAVTLRDRTEPLTRAAREAALLRESEDSTSQLESLQARVRASAIAQTRLWNAAAHELRTPLAVAQSHLEVVLTDLLSEVPERPAALLRTASESLRRLEHLIADVMDAAAGAEFRPALHLEEIDIGEVVRHVSAELGPSAARRGVSLTVDVPRGLAGVSADREKAERLLSNLLEHSLRLTPRRQPRVAVSARAEDDRVVVRIVDHGPLLTPEKAAHLFDDLGAARAPGDIGLSVARRLAEAMGARVAAEVSGDGSNVKTVTWRAASATKTP